MSKCLWEKLGIFFPSHKGNKISLEVTKMILVMKRGRVYHIVNGSLTPSMRSEEGLGRATREGRNFLSIVTVGPQVEPGGQDRTDHLCYMPWSSENFRYCRKNVQETPESIQLEGDEGVLVISLVRLKTMMILLFLFQSVIHTPFFFFLIMFG